MDKLTKVKVEIERLKEIAEYNISHSKMDRSAWMQQASVCTNLLSFINSLKKESVIEPQVKESLISKHEDKTCKENGNSLTKEPVSEIDFEQELYKYFGQVKDFTLGMRIAKRFYEIGRNYQEPVSEDLEEVIRKYEQRLEKENPATEAYDFASAIRFGANWHKQQLMAKAVDGLVVCNNFTHGYKDILMEIPSYLNVDDEVKVIIIKED